jgi:hypothetical protein
MTPIVESREETVDGLLTQIKNYSSGLNATLGKLQEAHPDEPEITEARFEADEVLCRLRDLLLSLRE